MKMADAVHQSRSGRREMLGMIMDDHLFSSNSTVESSPQSSPNPHRRVMGDSTDNHDNDNDNHVSNNDSNNNIMNANGILGTGEGTMGGTIEDDSGLIVVSAEDGFDGSRSGAGANSSSSSSSTAAAAATKKSSTADTASSVVTTTSASNASGAGGSVAASTEDKPKKDRRPRSQTVAELKQQLQDCHNALLTMRENANLKYRKLELEFVETKSALSATRAELDVAKVECQNLEKDKQVLADKLSRAVGDDKAAWLNNMQEKTKQLERALSISKLERDDKVRANDELRAIMTSCPRCRRTLPQAAQPLTKAQSVRSLWGWGESLTGALVGGLNDEAEATPSPQPQKKPVDMSRPQPPPEMFSVMEQSERIKEDLEADIEEMERQMKSDIESLKSEWAKAPKVHHREKSSKKTEKKKKSKKKSSNKGISSLDSFFSTATAGLEDEEMDEEKSFFSMSRSVKTDTHVDKARRKKHKNKSRKKSSHAATDEDLGRRTTFRTRGKGLSIRDNLQEKILGLGEEELPQQNGLFRTTLSTEPNMYGDDLGDDAVFREDEEDDEEEEGVDNAVVNTVTESRGFEGGIERNEQKLRERQPVSPEAHHFDDMARQVEAWGVEANRSTTVL